jgi:hypothetical protein
MDPVSLAFGAALVGAIATDEWPRVREAVVGLWRRLRPKQQADDVEAELGELREQVLAARRDKDVGTEKALEGAWQVKAHQLVRADASVAEKLRRVLDEVLSPALSPAGQARVGTIIMTGSSHDSSTFTQIGTQVNYPRP